MPAPTDQTLETSASPGYALLIGIDHYDTLDPSAELPGSRNDVLMWYRFCRNHLGIPVENIRMLTGPLLDPSKDFDAGTVPPESHGGADEASIRDGYTWLLTKRDGGKIPGLLTYSGHGLIAGGGPALSTTKLGADDHPGLAARSGSNLRRSLLIALLPLLTACLSSSSTGSVGAPGARGSSTAAPAASGAVGAATGAPAPGVKPGTTRRRLGTSLVSYQLTPDYYVIKAADTGSTWVQILATGNARVNVNVNGASTDLSPNTEFWYMNAQTNGTGWPPTGDLIITGRENGVSSGQSVTYTYSQFLSTEHTDWIQNLPISKDAPPFMYSTTPDSLGRPEAYLLVGFRPDGNFDLEYVQWHLRDRPGTGGLYRPGSPGGTRYTAAKEWPPSDYWGAKSLSLMTTPLKAP